MTRLRPVGDDDSPRYLATFLFLSAVAFLTLWLGWGVLEALR